MPGIELFCIETIVFLEQSVRIIVAGSVPGYFCGRFVMEGQECLKRIRVRILRAFRNCSSALARSSSRVPLHR